MGGIGSGNWIRPFRKQTVDETLRLSMSEVRDQIFPNSHGRLVWDDGERDIVVASFTVTMHRRRLFNISFSCLGTATLRQTIELSFSPTNFGGQRLWFMCPGEAGEKSCSRRTDFLYLLPDARFFACRQCHRLTYRSSQTSHWKNRLIDRLYAERVLIGEP